MGCVGGEEAYLRYANSKPHREPWPLLVPFTLGMRVHSQINLMVFPTNTFWYSWRTGWSPVNLPFPPLSLLLPLTFPSPSSRLTLNQLHIYNDTVYGFFQLLGFRARHWLRQTHCHC